MTETNSGDRALPDMPETILSCAQVEAGDYEARYLANRLSPAEAEAYEAHYFGCERCWSSLRRATEARAAFANRRRPRWVLPAAAAAVAAFVTVWQFGGRGPDTPPVVLRGGADTLALTIALRPDSIHAAWPRHPDADVYRVRGFTADGVLTWSIETQDTTLAAPGGAIRVDVAALDRARTVIAQSALIRVGNP